MNKNCQSCAMPLRQDPQGGGTEKDGAKNDLYCSYCYQDGAFTQPGMSAIDMQLFVQNILWEKFKIPRFLSRFMTRGIPNLARWKKQ